MNDIHRYSPARRYASPLERPAPRSSRWMLAAGFAVIWSCAAIALWSVL